MDAVVPIPLSAGQATLGEAIAESRRELDQAGIESAEQEALWIVQHVLRLPAHHVVIDRDRLLASTELADVKGLIQRRVGREPLQYILGTQEFCGLEFHVNSAVLIPRPETELLVEYVAQRISAEQSATIVDVCTGSGCIAVAIARQRPRHSNTPGPRTDIDDSSRLLDRNPLCDILHQQLGQIGRAHV